MKDMIKNNLDYNFYKNSDSSMVFFIIKNIMCVSRYLLISTFIICTCICSKVYAEDVSTYYDLYLKCEASKNPIKSNTQSTYECKQLDSLINALEDINNNLESTEKDNLEKIYSDVSEKLKDKNLDLKDKLYLLINKAKTLNIILLVNKNSKEESSKKYKQEILEAFDYIIDESGADSFEKEQALYLKSLFYEKYSSDIKRSLFYHQILSESPFKTKYGLLSSIYLGDHFYSKKDYNKSISFYLKAKNYLANKEREKYLDNLEDKDRFYYESYFNIDKDIVEDMNLKLSYRLSWSYFLNHNVSKSIEEASLLLSNYSSNLLNMHKYRKVEEDMISIIVDSLYESSYKDQDRYFKNKNFVFKESISLDLSRKYKQELLYKDCIRVAESYFYPETKQYLYLLSNKASCYSLNNQKDDNYLQTLEQLASLSDSGFWKTRYQNDSSFIKDLNTISNEALEEVADIYYNDREKSYSYAQKSLIMYESLLKKNPSSNQEVFWNIRILYSLYSLSLYDNLIARAQVLKIKKDLTNKQYSDIGYILIKAKIDKLYALNTGYRSSNNNDTKVNDNDNGIIKDQDSYIKQLDEDILLYSKSEKDLSRVEEILLMVASSFKNLYMYEKAIPYYKTLLSNLEVSSNSKTIAIRGIVFCGIKVMKTSDLISTLTNLLKTQDLNNISVGLESELLSILSTSLLKEGDNLYELAEFDKGSRLLISSVGSFPNITEKNKICTLGLEMLSLSNRAYSSDLDISVCNNDKDLYIKAKFLENNLNFSEAAATYLEFIEKNPNDTRVKKSIDRSLKLFSYENDKINTALVLYKKALYYKGKDDIYNYKKYRLKSLVLYQDQENLYPEKQNNVLDNLALSIKKEKNLNQLEKDTLIYLDSKNYLNSFNSEEQGKGISLLEGLILSYNKDLKLNKKIEEERICLMDDSYNSLASFYESSMIKSKNLDKKFGFFNKSLELYSNVKGSCKVEDISNSNLSILRISKYMLDILKTKNKESSFDVYKSYSKEYPRLVSLVHKYYDLVNKGSEDSGVGAFDADMKTLNNFIHY